MQPLKAYIYLNKKGVPLIGFEFYVTQSLVSTLKKGTNIFHFSTTCQLVNRIKILTLIHLSRVGNYTVSIFSSSKEK